MDEVKAWLNSSRNYEQGAALYLKYGKDKALHRAFSEPSSDFKRRRLADALLALYRGEQKTEVVVKETKEQVIERTIHADRQWPAEPDNVLAALKEQWKPKFAEMMHLCTIVYDIALKGEADPAMKVRAGEIAHQILDLDDECDEIYAQRDYYMQHGQLRSQEQQNDDLVVDPKKIPLALQNAQRYVREYKGKVAKEPTNEKAAAKLKLWQARVRHYKQQLNLTE